MLGSSSSSRVADRAVAPLRLQQISRAHGAVRPKRGGRCALLTTALAPPRKEVVCVGEGLFDLIANQKGLARDKVQSWTPYAGGAPLNVATSLGKLGVHVYFVSALGKDERGEELLQKAEARNVDLSAVQLRDEPTRDVYVTLDNDGDRTFAGFGLPTEQYSDCFLDADKLPLDTIKRAAVLVTGTLGLAYPQTRQALQRAVQAAKQGGCKVLVDINWRPVFWPQGEEEARRVVAEYLEYADIIKISDADLEWLLHTNWAAAKEDPTAIVNHYPKAVGVLLTAGGDGAAYAFRTAADGKTPSNPGNDTQHPTQVVSGFVPAFKVDVVDTTGAGDAFTAGFVYKVVEAGSIEKLAANPRKLQEAVVFSAACGGLVATRKGAIDHQPSLEECEKLAHNYVKSHV